MKSSDQNPSSNERLHRVSAKEGLAKEEPAQSTVNGDMETQDRAAQNPDADQGGVSENSDEFDNCLQLIRRVKTNLPECLADIASSPAETMWLSGEGDCPPQIGRFQIRKKVGEGGFGLVFLARDPQLDRDVALKAPRVETLVTNDTRERFLQEGRAAARLSHPSIATVFESGKIGPICYIASEYCEGGSLAELLQGRDAEVAPLSAEGAALLIQTLAEAVHFSHNRGVLHRDLKPSNVMLGERLPPMSQWKATNRAALEEQLASAVRIVDFGLAKSLDDNADRTRTGAILGTPQYMSPEQAVGDPDRISAASDVYSIGAMLYEVVCGAAPFADVPQAIVPHAVINQEPVSLRKQAPRTPRDLEAICMKCLEKSPERRYRSAAALVADLDRFRSGASVEARPVTWLQHYGRWCSRNPVVAGLTATIAILLVAAAVVFGVAYQRTNSALEETKIARAETRRRYELAQQVVDDYLVATSDDERLKAESLQPLRRKLLERAKTFYEQIRSDGVPDPSLESAYALALWRLAIVDRQMGDYQAAEIAFADSIQVFTKLIDDNHADPELRNHLGRCYLDFGLVYFRQANLASESPANRKQQGNAADSHWRKAFEIYAIIDEQNVEIDDPKLQQSILQNSSTAHSNLGMLHVMSDQNKGALPYYLKALKLREQLVERYPDDVSSYILVANSQINLGLLYRKIGDPEKEIKHLSRSVELLRPVVKRHPKNTSVQGDFAQNLISLALATRNRGDGEIARKLRKEGMIALEQLCFDQPLVPRFKISLAGLYFEASADKKRPNAEREDFHRQGRELLAEVRRRHPQHKIPFNLAFMSRMNEGVQHRIAGDIDGARKEFQAALTLCDAELAVAESSVIRLKRTDAVYCLAHLQFDNGDPVIILEHLNDSTAELEKLVAISPNLPNAEAWLGRSYHLRASLFDRLGKANEAHRDWMRAARLGVRVRNEDKVYELTRALVKSPGDPRLLRDRAYRWYARLDYAAAIHDCSQAIDIDPEHARGYLIRAWSRANTYEFGKSIHDYEAAIARSTADAWTLRDLAWLYAIADEPTANPERAVEFAKRAIDLAKNDDARLISLSTLGVALYHAGEYQAGLDAFARMKTEHPHFESLFYQSLCHLELGQNDEAAKLLARAKTWNSGPYRRIEGELSDMKPYLQSLQQRAESAFNASTE